MGFLSIVLIAVGLAMDAMAVALGIGTTPHASGERAAFRLSWHFGLFQFLMPIIGWLGGVTIKQYFGNLDAWIAFGLLAFVGGRMVRSGIDPNAEMHPRDPSRGGMLVMLSLAVSIDALAVGISLGVLGVAILVPSIIIGVVTGALTLLGLNLGGRLGVKFGKRMEIVGGLILIAIGVKALIR